MQENEELTGKMVAWFGERMLRLPRIQLTLSQVGEGVEALPKEHAELFDLGQNFWSKEVGYSITHPQLCRAFFRAATQTGVVKIKDGVLNFPVPRDLAMGMHVIVA
jgi:hypothetical protein